MAGDQQGAAPPPPRPHADDELEFFSPCFDPRRALLQAGVAPPLPAARPLDSIFRCRFMLPDGHPDAWREPARGPKTKEALEAAQREKSRLSYVQQKQERQNLKTNPIDAIVQRVREGPLLLLKACYQQRSRVRVVTRHAHGVRGASEGTLVAFDRYLNLVLRDVEEQYTVLLRVQRPRPPGPDGRERVRWARQQEHRRRQLRQVFVRGDSVVLVSAASSGGATPGAAAGKQAAAGRQAAASGHGAAAAAWGARGS